MCLIIKISRQLWAKFWGAGDWHCRHRGGVGIRGGWVDSQHFLNSKLLSPKPLSWVAWTFRRKRAFLIALLFWSVRFPGELSISVGSEGNWGRMVR